MAGGRWLLASECWLLVNVVWRTLFSAYHRLLWLVRALAEDLLCFGMAQAWLESGEALPFGSGLLDVVWRTLFICFLSAALACEGSGRCHYLLWTGSGLVGE